MPTDRPLPDLTAELTTMLGSTDPVVRDEIAYPILATWVSAGVYDDLLAGLGDGMAAAIRGQFQLPTKAKVRMRPDGIAVVQTDMTDIGTGTYTILTQVAADGLGLPIDRVRVERPRGVVVGLDVIGFV